MADKVIYEGWTKDNNICAEGKKWWEGKSKIRDIKTVIDSLVVDDKYDWAIWFIFKTLEPGSKLSFVTTCLEAYSVNGVIGIVDDKMTTFIEQLKEYQKNPNKKNLDKAKQDKELLTTKKQGEPFVPSGRVMRANLLGQLTEFNEGALHSVLSNMLLGLKRTNKLLLIQEGVKLLQKEGKHD